MSPLWSIGMPSYNNFTEVYFTVQSLRLHHNLKNCEIIVVDNYGDPVLENFCKAKGGLNNWEDFKKEYPAETLQNFNRLIRKEHQGESNSVIVRYEKYNKIRGVSVAKNRIFEIAKGEFVMCMDSHILIQQGAFDTIPSADDFVQGPCLFNDMKVYKCEWLPQWRRNMWGIWGESLNVLPDKIFEIWAMGAGFFCCRRELWLGFNPAFRGFGGETGYIQEKYRQAGRKVLCDPTKVWVHLFSNTGRTVNYNLQMSRRVANYILGFRELGLDLKQIEDHFGEHLYKEALQLCNTPL
jgi:glycosyltransferase involved in cell wall biosynthesis